LHQEEAQVKYYAEANALAPILQKMANGVDDRIVVEVEKKKGSWGWRLNDPWGGDYFEDSFQKVKTFIQSGY